MKLSESMFYLIDEEDHYEDLPGATLEFHENDPDYYLSFTVQGTGTSELGVCIGVIDLIRIVHEAKKRGISAELFN